jgi:hypothetical protein
MAQMVNKANYMSEKITIYDTLWTEGKMGEKVLKVILV